MRRFSIQLLWALLLLFGAGGVRALAAEEAPQLAPEYTASQNAGDVWALSDGERITRYRANGQTTIKLASPQPVSQLYVVWETPPQPWKLGTEQGESAYGQNGFIHEYVRLEEPLTELTITTEGETVLCDIYAFGAGDAPDWVQQWQPPYEDADMLLLPTHADDEHLFFGGTMPLYAGERGLKVQVAYLTNHWAEPYRPHELLNGLWTVGVTAYPVISNFVDLYAGSLEQAKGLYAEAEVTAHQVELLRRFRPEVVVGHDINGEYGHGVHIYNTYTLQKALELSADAQQYPESAAKYGTWDVPKTYLHLFGENATLIDWNIPLERFGGKTAIEMAKEGFAQHKSQQEFFKVEDYGPYDCRKFGLYRSTVGADSIGGDFMENLAETDFSDYAPPEPEPEPPPLVRAEQPAPPKKEVAAANDVLLLVVLAAGVALLVGAVAAIALTVKKRRRR